MFTSWMYADEIPADGKFWLSPKNVYGSLKVARQARIPPTKSPRENIVYVEVEKVQGPLNRYGQRNFKVVRTHPYVAPVADPRLDVMLEAKPLPYWACSFPPTFADLRRPDLARVGAEELGSIADELEDLDKRLARINAELKERGYRHRVYLFPHVPPEK